MLEVGPEDLARGGVVVDDERASAPEVSRYEGAGFMGTGIGQGSEWDAEVDAGAPTGFAFEQDATAHELDEALADDESEAGAAIASGDRVVGLGEGLEQSVALVLGEADAGVGDREGALESVRRGGG